MTKKTLGEWEWEPGGAVSSCPQKLLDHVARHGIEEEANHDDQQEGQNDFDDKPFVTSADEVLDRLEWVQEPDKGCIRTTVGGEKTHKISKGKGSFQVDSGSFRYPSLIPPATGLA